MRRLAPGVLIAVMIAAGCAKEGDPAPVPTPIAAPSKTDTATGVLMTLGNNYYQFQVTQASEVDVTLQSLTTVPVDADPNADPPVAAVPAMPVSVPLALVVGQPSLTTLGVSCSPLKSVVTEPGPNPQLRGQALAGTYCIAVGDVTGVLPAAVNYTILIAHS